MNCVNVVVSNIRFQQHDSVLSEQQLSARYNSPNERPNCINLFSVSRDVCVKFRTKLYTVYL